MVLIIPAIHIREGKCYPKIDYYQDHNLPPCESPIEEPRLLRKENAKALHLFFDNDSPFSERNLSIIRQIRTCIDLPLGITVDSITGLADLQALAANGIYRIFMRNSDNDEFLKNCLSVFPSQKISPYINLQTKELGHVDKLKSMGFSRLAFEYDSFMDKGRFSEFKNEAAINGLRLTLVSCVSSYKELMQLDELAPTVDSVILNDTLEHDPFPCQAIWRQAEERAFLSAGKEANLWKNPLEGTVHI